MSVTINAFLVDWDELVSKYDKLGDNLSLWEAIDEEEKWLEEFDMDGSEISLSSAMSFSDLYKELRPNVSENDRVHIDNFLSVFTVADDNEAFTPVRDLGTDIDEEIIFGSMSTDSVRKYLALYNGLNLESLRIPFNDYKKSINEAMLFDDFEQFLGYIKLWGNLLESAANKNRAIVTLMG